MNRLSSLGLCRWQLPHYLKTIEFDVWLGVAGNDGTRILWQIVSILIVNTNLILRRMNVCLKFVDGLQSSLQSLILEIY